MGRPFADIRLIGRAITQVPAAYRPRLVVRADEAGATHELLDRLTGLAESAAID
jgi:hypothetical protein